MKLDKSMAELICTLENIVGWQTYNPNSYNGWTGEEGCSFKYPINYCENKKALKEEKLTKIKSKIPYIEPECIKTMKYAFGSNHLYIGDGIVKVLEFLEKTYDIDFNELENSRIEKCKEKMRCLQKELEAGEEIPMKSGRWKVGIDIPEGEYIIQKNDEFRYLMISITDEQGKEVQDIFSDADEVKATLKNGYEIHSHRNFILKTVAKI